MDKKQAQALIKGTFEAPFDKNRFIGFVKNLLNDVEDATFIYKGNYIPDAYEQYINTLERVGKYNDGEHKIDVLIAKLKKATSIERARTMQRNFVAWYLNGSRGGELKDGALVAFVAPNEEDWRFSLVKMDYRFEESKKGQMRVKEEFTPARRWSFLVGINENSHTAQSQLVDLVADDERNPVIAQLEEAFNIEKVTKEFFEKYRELFLWTKETLEAVVKKDKKIRDDFEAKEVNTVDFSKKLLGQIVFLYFLQKKGWFGVKRDADWGTGPKNFLRELFEKKHGTYNNFFNDILEPLFYEALARERDDDFYSRFNCKIPFLNGGLFDPINDYDWVHTDILLPNDLFSNSYKTKQGDKGNGILDIFDRYNFTVKEDEPLEKEVAVDPEMLGKVFENLLEVKDRKSKGTYYTPREIVHYMCVQSLVNYLVSGLEGKVTKADCEKLIKYGESVSENEARVEAMGKETQTYYYKLSESIRANAKLIDEKLADVKICDPAIGSGAFPVGMMTEIVRARNTLSSYIKGSDRTPYNFKRDCIHNSLYGVDIDPGAVEIAKLRLWLSLVVDESDIKQIKPLPNLEYKIMQGNSLLEEFEGVRLFDERIIATVDFDKEKQIADLKGKQSDLSSEYIRLHQANKLTQAKKRQINDDLKKISSQIRRLEQSGKKVVENASLFDMFSNAKKKSDDLKQLHKEFFETTQKTKKDDLKRRIERLEWDLIEVTLKEQGKQSELKKLEEFKRSNIKPFFLWKLHFSEVFQNGGFDVVIANPPYVSYGLRGGQKMTPQEKEILKRAFPNSAEYKISLYALFMDKAIQIAKLNGGIQTYIVPDSFLLGRYFSRIRGCILRVNEIKHILLLPYGVFDATVGFSVVYSFQRKEKIDEHHNIIARFAENNQVVQQGTFKELSYPQEYFNNLKHNRFRLFFDEKSMALIFKIENNANNLGNIVKFSSGLIGKSGQKSIISNEQKSKKWLPGIISGGEINRYVIVPEGNFLLYDKSKIKSGYDCVEYFKEKLFMRQTGDSLICAYDDKGLLALNNVHIGNLIDESYSLKFITAVINSNLLNYYYKTISLETGRVMAQTDIETIDGLPICNISHERQKEVISIVDKVLSITRLRGFRDNQSKVAEVSIHIKRLDNMIYKLYGLDSKEVETVEALNRKK
ncbi:MAG: N-6 DNA methylase [Candidatus Omnitrophica bacterium]|nr:N-6 DNA methylase [Candidatus Omnitrophota bacterium]